MRKLTDKYEILEQVGRGSYANVYRAINRQTGQVCAIKKIDPFTSELDNLMNEINIMSDCDCKNIVKFLESDCLDKEVSIVMEFCRAGSVKDVMRQLKRTLTEQQIIVITRDVLQGLDYLHSKGKIHRDVKAANILLDENGVAKLGDFGISEPLDTSDRRRDIMGTPLWLPPEVINRKDRTQVSDIWSLGITVIEMGDGQPPYSELEQIEALREIRNCDKPASSFHNPSAWSPEVLDFLRKCLVKDSAKRRKAAELLALEIFKKPPPSEVIRSLVKEVCSSSSSRDAQLEMNLYRRAESLLRESSILFGIYKDRRMEVIRVDQMKDQLSSIEGEFEGIQENMLNSQINELRSQLDSVDNEKAQLERERNDLKTTLASLNDRRTNILTQLNTVREKQKRYESLEQQRIMKLRSLESKGG